LGLSGFPRSTSSLTTGDEHRNQRVLHLKMMVVFAAANQARSA